jgi:hypothetical protein
MEFFCMDTEISPIRKWTPEEIRRENERRGVTEIKPSPRLLKAREKEKLKEAREKEQREKALRAREKAVHRRKAYDVLRDLRKLKGAAEIIYDIFMDDPLPTLDDLNGELGLNVFVVAGALELLVVDGRLFLHEMPSKVGYTITPIAEADMLVIPIGLRDKTLQIMAEDRKRSKRH